MTAAHIDKQYMKHLDERQRRLYAATLALKYGYGGIKKVHEQMGIDFNTIRAGIKDLQNEPLAGRVRKKGGGRKKSEYHQPKLIETIDLEARPNADKKVLVKHTSRSFANIAEAVVARGFQIGRTATGRILKDLGYALKANKKEEEGDSDHPDRDLQFQHINMQGLKMQIQGFPILSIDCKKTEKIGNMKNNGREWLPKGEDTKVNVYDFGEKDTEGERKGKIKKAIPYGVYDINKNKGFVNVGIDANTAEFAVASLRRWWNSIGKETYGGATEILLFADCGSSNGYRNRLWKYSLQKFANYTQLTVHVSHYPPGTSKWNDIEHRMFSFININWRAKPLTAYEVVLELIKHTTTRKGLTIEAELDEGTYKTGIKITDQQMQQLNITGAEFHPEWNYTITPQVK